MSYLFQMFWKTVPPGSVKRPNKQYKYLQVRNFIACLYYFSTFVLYFMTFSFSIGPIVPEDTGTSASIENYHFEGTFPALYSNKI